MKGPKELTDIERLLEFAVLAIAVLLILGSYLKILFF